MDTCYAVDNLYNRTMFCERRGQDPDTWTWDSHFETLKEQVVVNFQNCNRLKVAEELGKGEYSENGVVLTQLKKKNKDAEKPPFEVEIDPWTRYEPLEKERGDEWKSKLKDESWVHPVVQKALNIKAYYDEHAKGGRNGEIEYTGKQLISVNGKIVGGFGKAGSSFKGAAAGPPSSPAANAGPVPPP